MLARCRRAAFALLALLAAMPALAQAPAYPPVLPRTPIVFPRDHGAHADYRIEWWYLTGWLEDDRNEPLGFQLTIFRLRSGAQEAYRTAFAARQLLFAHAAISDPALGRLRHAEKSAREGFGIAYAEPGDTRVGIDGWAIERRADGSYLARVQSDEFAYELIATPPGPPMLNGEHGFSQKAPDPRNSSHYYSRPQMAVSGWVEIAGRRREVRGTAWFDHEWSSELLPEAAAGWDWLGANFADGGALMAFRLRDKTGRTLWASATDLRPGQAPRPLAPKEVEFTPGRRWRSPRTGVEYPVEFTLRAGERRLELVPLIDDQELDTRRSVGAIYWEGAVRIRDAAGREVGRGYLELTGYGVRMRM